jgi:hypothetical protein
MTIGSKTVVSKPDRDRLSKIVGMLGSSHDNERANAAAFIDAMAKRYKISVADLLAAALAPEAPQPRYSPPPPPPPPPHQPPPRWHNVRPSGPNTDLLDTLRTIAQNEEAFEFVLSNWECDFAADVGDRYSYDSEL